MKTKRAITALLIFAMTIAAASSAFAVTLTVGTNSGASDATLQVPITVDNPVGIAGAAFTVTYDTTALTLIDIESTFFDTFANQWVGTPNEASAPTSVTVDSQTYSQPLITNDITGVGTRIAAARCTAETTSSNTTLFTLSFRLKSGAQVTTYNIGITATTLNNTDAGYAAEGEAIPVLVGSDLSVTDLTDPSAFPILLDPANGIGTVVAGSVTFTALGTYSISGTVGYTGSQTGTIYVGAFDGPDPGTANKISCTPIDQPGAFTIEGLPNGTYYIGAYRDSDGGVTSPDIMDRDPTEARGMYPTLETPTAVTVSDGNVTGINFSISDPDSDSDGIPDYWEKTHFGNLTTADATSDYDKDGYSDLQEYTNGGSYDPTVQDEPGGNGYNSATDSRVAPASWTLITGNQYNMVVHGTAYDGQDFAATDDWIGAFGPGGESDCRAIGQVTANGGYYLTVRGNANGEIITFKLRRGSDLKILDAPETVSFVSDGTEADKDLHFTADRTQSIAMIVGWNWVSFNVLPADTSLEGFFGAHSGDIEQVKTQITSATNIEGYGWMGDDLGLLSNIASGVMFKIKAKAAFTLEVTGAPIAPDTAIDLVSGWSWVAYLPESCSSVANSVASIIGDLVQVKSQTESQTKIAGDLMGDLTQMCPGQGYTINMNASGSLIYPNQ